jgi:hypothetical protein
MITVISREVINKRSKNIAGYLIQIKNIHKLIIIT